MGTGTTNGGGCKRRSHQMFKDRVKNMVDDLQGMLSDLQSARKESRSIDVAVLEEQGQQMLREWRNELNEPSPASSLQQGGSYASFSSDIRRLCQAEEDDATSAAPPKPELEPEPEPDEQKVGVGAVFNETFSPTRVGQLQQGFELAGLCKGSPSRVNDMGVQNIGIATQLDYNSFEYQELEQIFFSGLDGRGGLYGGENALPQISGFLPNICPPPSAFLGPKCALWDCPRPAQIWCFERPDQGLYPDYCSSLHAAIAQSEGRPGMSPVIRPKGIELKDNLLFAALSAKVNGKDVGVPECEGAASAKSPWNAPDLFDLSFFEGETIREWLFFDKPRRAFESGNRKQRSLPDYNGRGWHESRKQVINESGWLKRSYFMDPQPMTNLEWHLFEYEISKSCTCALYRLEFKLVDGKKSPKGKNVNDPVADLQKQMGRLTAETQLENMNNKRSDKGRGKANLKDESGTTNLNAASNQTVPVSVDFGANGPFNYLVEDEGGYYNIT